MTQALALNLFENPEEIVIVDHHGRRGRQFLLADRTGKRTQRNVVIRLGNTRNCAQQDPQNKSHAGWNRQIHGYLSKILRRKAGENRQNEETIVVELQGMGGKPRKAWACETK